MHIRNCDSIHFCTQQENEDVRPGGGGGEEVEKSRKSESDGKDEPLVVDVVHKEGHQGADHDAHAEEGGCGVEK